MKNHEGPWSHYLWQPRFCWFHQFDPWTNPEKYVKIPIWMSQIIKQTPPCLDHPQLRPSPPFSAATRPRPSPERPSWGTCWASAWHTPRGEPFPQRVRCPVRPVFGAPHGGAPRARFTVEGATSRRPKWTKYLEIFQDFVSCISAVSAVSGPTWYCYLLGAVCFFCQAIFMLHHRDSCACRWKKTDRSSGICHVCTDVGPKGQDCQMAFSDVIGGIRTFLRKSHVFLSQNMKHPQHHCSR